MSHVVDYLRFIVTVIVVAVSLLDPPPAVSAPQPVGPAVFESAGHGPH